MTVVVAVTCNDGTVVMGGDSFCGDEDLVNVCRADKVYLVGPVGVGICGSVRSEQLLDRVLREHIPEKKEISEEWLRNDFTDFLHDAMKEHGSMHDREGTHEMRDSHYIIVFDGVTYYLETDFSLWESRRPLAAIGIGRKIAYGAMGAMLSTLGGELPDVEFAENMVRTALAVSAEWSPWVVPPFTVITVPPNAE